MIHGKTLEAWQQSHPIIAELVALKQTSWFNPGIAKAAQALHDVGLTAADVQATRPAPSSANTRSPWVRPAIWGCRLAS